MAGFSTRTLWRAAASGTQTASRSNRTASFGFLSTASVRSVRLDREVCAKGLSQVRHKPHASPNLNTEACMAETLHAIPEAKTADTSPVVVVKKYANRRLYNTETSSYITLDNLADMVRLGRDFVVYDARSGDDITRSVLTQIIVEEEGKGQNLLPTNFLRQLIGLYGGSMQGLVPKYLEHAMSSFAQQQDQLR